MATFDITFVGADQDNANDEATYWRGFDEGRDVGVDEGYEDGLRDGFDEGYKQCEAELAFAYGEIDE
jgi:flagellar biosynthesis/type III secretory pathway protein FliH